MPARIRLHATIAGLALAMGSAGCGANVVVDQDGTGGAPPVADPCPAQCAAGDAAGCTAGAVGPCLDVCKSELVNVGPCRDLLATAFACYAEHVPTAGCSAGGACDAALNAAFLCITPAGLCEKNFCLVQNGVCKEICGGVAYESECPMDLGTTCTCRVDGAVVGTCTQTLPGNFIQGGCCSKFFAEHP